MNPEDLKDISAECDCSEVDFERNILGETEADIKKFERELKGGYENIEEWKKDLTKPIPQKYKDGKIFTGNCETKYGNGSRRSITQYSQGRVHGNAAVWDENGVLRTLENYVDGRQHGKQLKWDQNSKIIAESERKNGAWINNGFTYKEGALKSAWFNLPNKEILAFPENVSSFVFKTLKEDYNTKEKLYQITIQDKLTDKQLISFAKTILEKHFQAIEAIQIDKTAWDHIPNIDIHYNILEQGSIGDKERRLEHNAKEKEVERVASLLAKNFPKLKIPGTTGSNQEKKSLEQKETPKEAKSVNELMNKEESYIDETQSITNEKVQQYTISDPDGYSNLRIAPKGEVIQTVYEGELFEVIGEDGDYKKVKLEDGTAGYIHKSRVIIHEKVK